jgi:hypothetical protein
VIAQGGTGQMLSLPINEFLQQSFKEIGVEIDFKVVELERFTPIGARAPRTRWPLGSPPTTSPM